MAENLMNSDHKATNNKYRDNYDRIFGYPKDWFNALAYDLAKREECSETDCNLYNDGCDKQ